jgi:hypothetical protein
MDETEWGKLWAAVTEVQHGFEPGAVFIGGVAVYAHTKDSTAFKSYFAFSHDADFMISVADYTDLKDIEQVTSNRRLSKSQFYKGGFEFDVYVQGHNDLTVPYDEVVAASELHSGVRVACLEHLLILKLKAYEDRRGSAKGDKDEDDLLKILLLLSEKGVSPDFVTRIDDDMARVLEAVVRSDAGLRISGGNSFIASGLRKASVFGLEKVKLARSNLPKFE